MDHRMKRLLTLVLAALLCLSMLPLAAWAEDDGAYTIATPAQLRSFAEAVNGGETFAGQTVTLTADVSLGGEGSPFVPAGTSANPFKGTFDGGGHVVSGLYIASGSGIGLFGNVNGGTVKNVVVRGTVSGTADAAGVVGKLTAGTVQNCGNEAAVSGGSNVGGVVGSVNGDCTISGCYNTGAVSGTTGYIGGVTGYHWRAGVVESCYNAGAVSGPATVGGVTGGHKASSPVLNNCYNAGVVTDTAGNGNNIGAVVGASRGTNTNCWYLTGTGTDSKSGISETASLSAAQLGAAFKADNEELNGGNPVLTWQKRTPDVIIGSYEELKSLADAVNNGETYEGKLVRLDVNVYLGGEDNPWKPIGTASKPFKGTFDGGYHVISGLYIASGSPAALFGGVESGTVKNLVVRGSVKGSTGVAGIVSNLKTGKIQNCGNEAAVSGGSNVGGVVASVNGDCTISGCYNTGAVSGTTGYIGGVTGYHWRAGVVENCYNAGAVSGPATVGGVTGGHKASSPVLNNCYNAGVVTDTAGNGNNIGAVVGASRGTNTNCWYLTGTGTDSKSGISETASLSAAQLGDAFADGKSAPVLSWESRISTEEPVRPAFIERSAFSEQLAGYIKSAVASTKKNAGLGGTLLGSEGFLSGASSTATDWMALAMGRFGYFDAEGYHFLIDDGSGYTDYLAAMKSYIEQTYAENNGILHRVKATEWHRAVVAITALGGDPTAFGTYNGSPIDLIADGSYQSSLREGPGTQGLNGWIWGLIAMDTGLYPVPADAKYPRETFIREILKMQLGDGVNGNAYGGWVLGGYGSSSDVDMTAMAIQALAPYYADDTAYTYTNANTKQEVTKTVRQCVNEALDRLGSMQSKTGGFTSWNTENSESIAQVIVALCSLGMDPAKDERFVTADGTTLLDALLSFRVAGGGFCHVKSSGWNSMANDQATYALVSYWRLANGMRALYDTRGNWSRDTRAAIDAAVAAIDAAADPTVSGYKAQLKAALAAFRAVPADERRYVGNYAGLAAAIDMVGGEAALSTDDPYIVSVSVTKQPDKAVYTEGDTFDPAGMVVTAKYNDGSEKPLTGYTLSPNGKLELSVRTVYVVFGTLRASVSVTVKERMPWTGEGTEQSPYLIRTADDLAALAARVNSGKSTTGQYYALAADIDLSSYDNWTPIGMSGRQFDGTFDGCGHTIRNLTSKKNGLFGYGGTNAVIKRVSLTDSRIEAPSLSFIGGIVGWSNGADVIDCYVDADIVSGGYSGGVVGTVRDGGKSTISGCVFAGTITFGTSYHVGAIGGIVGHLSAGGNGTSVAVTVEDCYNTGSVTATDNAGGIVGRAQDGHVIRNVYNIGKVTVTGENIIDGAGAIVSMLTRDNEVTNAYYLKTGDADCGISNGTGETFGLTAGEMTGDKLIAKLGDGFKEDRYGLVNGGYPLVYWQLTADADAIDAVKAKIEAISEVTLGSEAAIKEAREAYDALTDAQKALVDNLDKLTAAEKKLAELKTLAQAKADAIERLKAAKPAEDYREEQQAEREAILAAAEAAINAAADTDTVTAEYDKAMEKLNALKTDRELTDEEAAKAVSDKIEAIGEVTLGSEAAIKEAREAYDALTDAQKTLVDNLDKLTAAEKKLAELTDEEAAKAVSDKIEAIGEVTLKSEAAIKEAREAYDALTDAQKTLVDNFDKLTAAEKTLAELKAAESGDKPDQPDTGVAAPVCAVVLAGLAVCAAALTKKRRYHA